jgi:hypothetical protein
MTVTTARMLDDAVAATVAPRAATAWAPTEPPRGLAAASPAALAATVAPRRPVPPPARARPARDGRTVRRLARSLLLGIALVAAVAAALTATAGGGREATSSGGPRPAEAAPATPVTRDARPAPSPRSSAGVGDSRSDDPSDDEPDDGEP